MKNFKKVLSLVLVLALLLPGMAFANGLTEEINTGTVKDETKRELTEKEQTMVDEVRKLIQDIIKENSKVRDLEEDYNDDEIVRIIVELEERPVIVYATELGQSYENMPYSQKANIESKVYAAQEAVKNQILARNISMIYGRSFNTVFSGFSGEVKFADIEEIENITGVKKVYIANEYERPNEEPDMASSHDMIGSKDVWYDKDSPYKGEGMVIAIIDSGVDPNHKDFVLSEGTKTKIKENELPEGLNGKFFTDKVPYGFNYYDRNNEILDLGPGASEHGMHVAGTAVANGEIKGVAPEAQVLAMKVFSNDPKYATTFDDIYLEAIEESIKLKADVLNMSLGSSAAFYIAESAVDIAITNAVNNGIVCSISAGNSGYTYYGWDAYNGHGLPFKEDQDYGVVGAPGLSKDSLQVASIENLKLTVPYLEYSIKGVAEVLPRLTLIIGNEAFDLERTNERTIRRKLIDAINNDIPVFVKLSDTRFNDAYGNRLEDLSILPEIVTYIDSNGNESLRSVLPGGTIGEGKDVKAPMLIASPMVPRDVFGDNSVKYVDCGIGDIENFEGKNLEGKIALIIRGGITFVEKVENAQAAGAAGVIIYNHESGGEELINMAYPDNGAIPAVSIGHAAGKELAEVENATITFPEGEILAPNPAAGEMSDFTSWGTTPTLELKPEITAPGGMIYSTLQNGNYGVMSGTSMAAPHVAGGSALVQQYIKNHEKYGELSSKEQARLAKVLLMNTAEIVIDENSNFKTPYSPRRQGAGLMNLKAAVTTPVYVVNKNTNEAKVELKDFDSKTITMNLKAVNDSKVDLIYNVEVDVLADLIYSDLDLNLLESRNVKSDITITDNGKITVPANGEKEFTVTIDFSKDEGIYENMFIEGFVKLTEVNDDKPALGIPYVGFYGDWNKPRTLDAMEHEVDEDEGVRSYYEFSFMMSKGQFIEYEDIFAITPGTEDGLYMGTDGIVPVLSFLRNVEKAEYNILDEDYNKIRTIRNENYVRKNLFDRGRYNPYSYVPARTWDGKAKGKIVDDGLYYYQIRTKVQNGDWQEKTIPVYVDTKAPVITDLEYDVETGMLSWTATDEGTGLLQFLVFVEGDYVTDGYLKPEEAKVEGEENRYQYNIKEFVQDLPEGQENLVEVGALDHAWNTGFGVTAIGKDDDVPHIYLDTPDLLEVYNKSDIEFNGYIYKDNKVLKSLKIAEEEVFFRSNSKVPVKDDNGKVVGYAPGYTFTHTLKDLNDGIQQIKIEAETAGGKKSSIVRRFYIDTQKPELNVTVLTRQDHSATAELEINMKDNFPVLKLLVFDSEEFNYDGFDTYLSFNGADETITVTVDLDIGENLIPIKLVDVAGNETTTEVKITRTVPSAEEAVRLDKEALRVIYAQGDSTESVTKDLRLPTASKYGSFITWKSSNKDVISNSGKVTRPKEDMEVTLTATISYEDVTDTKEFTVKVIARDPIDKSELEAKIEEAEKLEARFYTEESWEIFAQALADAKTVLAKEDATQAEVDEALSALTNAMEALVELSAEDVIEDIVGRHGTISQDEKEVYVAYILFNIKKGFVGTDEDVVVMINGVGLEMKEEGKEEREYRFEGMLENAPESVIVKIGEKEYDITGLFTWNEEGEVGENWLIEIYNNLQNK